MWEAEELLLLHFKELCEVNSEQSPSFLPGILAELTPRNAPFEGNMQFARSFGRQIPNERPHFEPSAGIS
jgi:hypothetical protein